MHAVGEMENVNMQITQYQGLLRVNDKQNLGEGLFCYLKMEEKY